MRTKESRNEPTNYATASLIVFGKFYYTQYVRYWSHS